MLVKFSYDECFSPEIKYWVEMLVTREFVAKFLFY